MAALLFDIKKVLPHLEAKRKELFFNTLPYLFVICICHYVNKVFIIFFLFQIDLAIKVK